MVVVVVQSAEQPTRRVCADFYQLAAAVARRHGRNQLTKRLSCCTSCARSALEDATAETKHYHGLFYAIDDDDDDDDRARYARIWVLCLYVLCQNGDGVSKETETEPNVLICRLCWHCAYDNL